jgi:hypothetical protein
VPAYSLAQVVARTGAKRRSIQLWADGGVLRSTRATDRAGTGVHRLLPEPEVRVAAILTPLADLGIPIGTLREFANQIRFALHVGLAGIRPGGNNPLEKQASEIGIALRRAINGEGENYLLFAYSAEDLWLNVSTDKDGPACINPKHDFPESLMSSSINSGDRSGRRSTRTVILVLDLSLLRGLLD